MNEGKPHNEGYDVETAVWTYMQQCRICSMEELFRHVPAFTANQLFLTVDRLSREGKVVLRYRNRAEYVMVRTGIADEWPYEMSSAPFGDRQ
ncbi:MAG: hypothetical protein LZF60_220015 [Nitrospira sp.]|nr:MAG: hypothetical protein LZF60_220015 [Nitrospira sp.]